MKKNWKIGAAVACVCFLVTVAYAAIGGSGSQTDPLVTLSYLNSIFTPKVQSMVDQAAADRHEQNKSELNAAVTDWDTKIKEAIHQAGVSGGSSVAFSTVELQPGQLLLVAEGCEVLLRSGTAGWVSEGAELLDSTAGNSLISGELLVANHLCVSMGNGVVTAAITQTEPTQPTSITGTVTAASLNVRAAPGGDIVGSLKKGDVVTVLSTTDGWYQIVCGTVSGYVSADYVTLDQTAAAPEATPAAETVVLLVRGTYQIQ